jgi:penicillin amidase
MTWFRRVIGGLIVLLFVTIGGGYLWLRSSLPQLSGIIVVEGASSQIEIIRDRHGVPHIRATTADDAYFGLGYAHAQDRLFQMDFMRRLGAGKLSEVVGPATLGLDRLMRVLGVYRLAEETETRLSPPAMRMLTAYSAGINSFLAGATLPPEFLLLGYRPALWRPADSLVWSRIMAMRLTGNWHTESLRASLSSRLTPRQINELWPEDNSDIASTTSAKAPELNKFRRMFVELLEDWPRELLPISASNSWVVAGGQSATGKPILANDPHLGFRAPGLWYLARIEAPDLTLTGATVPGVPYHILGHNGHIAWAFTSTGSDTQDLFIERLNPTDANYYITPEGPRAFEIHHETVKIAGEPDVTITIRRTRHGPVLSDLRPGLESIAGTGHVVALEAASLRKDDMTPEALFWLNRARGWQEFRSALRLFHAPQQNITYADTSGNIGIIASGRVPIRKAGNGATPAPGWTGSHDWLGFIPFEALPTMFNPASGRIINANNPIAPKSYPYFLGLRHNSSFRAERIHQMMDAAKQPQGLDSFAAMQLDSISLMARDLIPLMTRISPRNQRARRAVEALRGWDMNMARDRPEPLIFTAWLRTFNRLLYADELGGAFSAYWGLRPLFVRNVLKQEAEWCDDQSTTQVETCDALLQIALEATLDELKTTHGDDQTSWRWGDTHKAFFRHPLFGRIAGLNRIADIRIASDGGAYTVNRAQNRSSDPDEPFASIHGSGYRAIYNLADLNSSRFIQATGQSGHFLSAHYRDLTEMWRDGKYISIPASRDQALDGAIGTLILRPDTKDH